MVSRRLIAVGAAAVLLLSACATVPDSGAVQTGKDSSGGQQYLLQPVTVGPGPRWTPAEVVEGFLQAIASYAHGYAVAKQYLSNQSPPKGKSARSAWNRNPGWAVTVTNRLYVRQVKLSPQVQGGPSGPANAVVSVTAQPVATVTGEGQYQVSQDPSPWTWTATLKKIDGTWLITTPPKNPPPLYVSNFQRVYLPRNLYFLAPGGLDIHPALVPDPIFVPLQATSVEVAETLVKGLLSNPSPQVWLSGAAVTALAGAKLLGRVTINAGTATVNLGGTAASATGTVLSDILSQLVSTLASPSYLQPAIAQSVELELDGHPQRLASWSGGQPQQNGTALLNVPEPGPSQPLYTLVGHNEIQRWTGLSRLTPSVTKISVQTDSAHTPLTSIAVSPGGQYVAGLAQDGRAVYYGSLSSGAKLAKWTQNGPFTSLSWDSNGNLWAVGTDVVEMLHPNGPHAELAGLPHGSVVQMQVAPDGVRAALVVNGPNGNQLELCALSYATKGLNAPITGAALGSPVVIGADVTDPTQLTWYDPNDLIVLSQGSSGAALQEVPVNGDSSVSLIPVPGMLSITSAGPANPLVAGLTQGRLALTEPLNSTPTIHKDVGDSPAYPASS